MLSDNPIETGKRPIIREGMTDKAMNGPNNETNPNGQPKNGEPAKKSSFGLWITVLAIIAVVALAYWGVKRRQASAGPGAAGGRMSQPVAPVIAGTVQEKDVPIYLDGLGTVQAFNTVTVRARVDGQLKKVAFTEGQDVRTGDLLALIDPDPFQTALDQAKAKKVQDEAQLVNAQVNLKRETELLAAKIDSQSVYDAQKALTDQLDATVKADQAAIESAQVQLNYTSISSPIDGRTGIRQVDQGNIVHAADSNGVVVITQLRPISVVFTLPAQNLDAITSARGTNNDLKVLAIGDDNETTVDTGTLAVIDNQIDTSTATIRLKATFPNQQERLWPGEFVNVRLLVATRKNGLVVPTQAIQRGPTGAYVFVVEKEASGTNAMQGGGKGRPGGAASQNSGAPGTGSGTSRGAGSQGGTNAPAGPVYSVKMQAVTVADEVSGAEALVTSGLQKGERVVVDGQLKLQDGSLVRIAQGGKSGGTNANASGGDNSGQGQTNATQ